METADIVITSLEGGIERSEQTILNKALTIKPYKHIRIEATGEHRRVLRVRKQTLEPDPVSTGV